MVDTKEYSPACLGTPEGSTGCEGAAQPGDGGGKLLIMTDGLLNQSYSSVPMFSMDSTPSNESNESNYGCES